MEFHEKLQELRKSRGMTQEELAEALYVSRTAISKWESGRGYPSIDSLKGISKYFSVSIDDLLSGEKLLSIAEDENKSKIRTMCELMFGIVDLCSVSLIVLPLYPNTIDGYVYSVNLFNYSEIAQFNAMAHWILFLALLGSGGVKIFLRRFQVEKYQKSVTWISMGLGILSVLFLAMLREAYATVVAFSLLAMKSVLISRK